LNKSLPCKKTLSNIRSNEGCKRVRRDTFKYVVVIARYYHLIINTKNLNLIFRQELNLLSAEWELIEREVSCIITFFKFTTSVVTITHHQK
jgi:hypothetical protein